MNVTDAANILAKWRRFFANWQLGAVHEGSERYYAVANLHERTMLTRAEVSGITKILLDKGIVTQEELAEVMIDEYLYLSDGYAEQYPGFSAFDFGLNINLPEAKETLKKWEPLI